MLSKRLAAVLGALTLAVVALAPAGAAVATPVHTSSATVKSTPDDGCPTPWARDTFVRTTTITPAGEGTFKVTIGDQGTFTTNKGAKSPNNPNILVEARVTGKISGEGEFTVTGELKNSTALANLDGATVNNSGYPCKADVPADRTTGRWPLRFFKPGATASGIDPWRWVYTTACESLTESSDAKAVGNIVGRTCPAEVSFTAATCAETAASIKVFNPNSHATLKVRFNAGVTHHVKPGKSVAHAFSEGSVQVKVGGKNVGVPFRYEAPSGCATPTPTVTATAVPTPTVTPTVAPTTGGPAPDPTVPTAIPDQPVGNEDPLPTTGAGVIGLAAVGGLLVAVGGGAFVFARRRRTRFTT